MASILAILTLAASPALASRGHEFKGAFSEPCLAEPCEGALKEPSGVAVNEATGQVYVVDKGANRVVHFKAGVFQGEVTGPSTTGNGSLEVWQAIVTGLLAVTGAFTVGEQISAAEEGLEPGTKIEAVNLGAGALQLSKRRAALGQSAEGRRRVKTAITSGRAER